MTYTTVLLYSLLLIFWLTFEEGWSTIDRQLEMNSFVILQLPASSKIGEQKTIRVCSVYLDWNFHIFRSCCNNNVQWERIIQQHFFSCVFDRSMKHILQEHILCHPTTICHVKIASSYSITYLCWIINAIETKGLKNNITSIEC